MKKLNVRGMVTLLLNGFCTEKEAFQAGLAEYNRLVAEGLSTQERVNNLSDATICRRGVGVLYNKLLGDGSGLPALVEKYGTFVLDATAVPTGEDKRDCRKKVRKRAKAR